MKRGKFGNHKIWCEKLVEVESSLIIFMNLFLSNYLVFKIDLILSVPTVFIWKTLEIEIFYSKLFYLSQYKEKASLYFWGDETFIQWHFITYLFKCLFTGYSFLENIICNSYTRLFVQQIQFQIFVHVFEKIIVSGKNS